MPDATATSKKVDAHDNLRGRAGQRPAQTKESLIKTVRDFCAQPAGS
jgi:hypothetical protein